MPTQMRIYVVKISPVHSEINLKNEESNRCRSYSPLGMPNLYTGRVNNEQEFGKIMPQVVIK